MERVVAGAAPPTDVLARFGLSGPVVPLAGGQGTAWRAGSAVLKPADLDPVMLAWQAALLTRLDRRTDFRVAPPMRAPDGSWIVSGWTAWGYEPGRVVARHWPHIVEVGRRFHRALVGEPEPNFLRDRRDIWAIGDKVAWAEVPARAYTASKHLPALISALRPLEGRAQLIHGDLTGNVLFDDELAPLVIDLSPTGGHRSSPPR